MNSATINLPWPPRALNPNVRHKHWATLHRAKNAYMRSCMWLALEARTPKIESERVSVALEFIPPDKRHRDVDNLVAAMKAGLDGVAIAIGVDDSRWSLRQEISGRTVKGGAVVMTIEW